LHQDLERIEREFRTALEAAGADARGVEAVRVRFLGRKGQLQGLMKRLGELSKDDRPQAGQAINRLKHEIERQVEQASAQAAADVTRRSLEQDRLDVTLPPRVPWAGSLHPVTQTRREMERIFL
jgi:phenylalanyl-tRNA synthetase alpha chain